MMLSILTPVLAVFGPKDPGRIAFVGFVSLLPLISVALRTPDRYPAAERYRNLNI